MQDCREYREQLSLYMDNMLDESQAKALEAHLAVCDACRQELSEMKEIQGMLQDLPARPLPAEFDSRLRKALLAEKAAREGVEIKSINSHKKGTFNYRKISAIAAIFVVGIFAIAMYNNSDAFRSIMPGNDKSMSMMENSSEMSSAEATMPEAAADIVDMANVTDGAMLEGADAGASEATAGGAQKSEAEAAAEDATAEGKPTLFVKSKSEPADMYDIAEAAGSSAEEDSATPEVMPAENTQTSNFVDDTATEENATSNATAPDRGDSVSGAGGASDRAQDSYDYYAALLSERLAGFSYTIVKSTPMENSGWTFEIELDTKDEKGNALKETHTYVGQEGKLEWINPQDQEPTGETM